MGQQRKSPTQPLLNVDNLSISFHQQDSSARAVDGLSFYVNEGETLAIMGESGSGKSVTAKAIMRLLPKRVSTIDEGHIEFDGQDLLELSDREMRMYSGRDIAMVFQDPMSSLNPVYTVGYQIAEASRRRFGTGRREARELAIEMLDRVGIPDPAQRAKDFPHQFSGGMQQRVMIAIALANDPRLLIADEPTTALDVSIQAQILDLMVEIKEENNMAMILITHDLSVVSEIADRGVVMYAGKCVESGAIRDMFDYSAHPYTKGLLSSIPTGHYSENELVPIPGSPPDIWKRPTGCRFAARCPLVQEVCLGNNPPLVPAPDPSRGHLSACHFDDEVTPYVHS